MGAPSHWLLAIALGLVVAIPALPAEAGTDTAGVWARGETAGGTGYLPATVQRDARLLDSDAYFLPDRTCGLDAEGRHYGLAYLREEGNDFSALVDAESESSVTGLEVSELRRESTEGPTLLLVSLLRVVVFLKTGSSAAKVLITFERQYIDNGSGWIRITGQSDPARMQCNMAITEPPSGFGILEHQVFDLVVFRGLAWLVAEVSAGVGGTGLLFRRMGF